MGGGKGVEEFINILIYSLLQRYGDIEIVKQIIMESDLDESLISRILERLEEIEQEFNKIEPN